MRVSPRPLWRRHTRGVALTSSSRKECTVPTVSLGALWLPIVLSAVLVFAASSIIHMVLGYHQRDYTPLPNEDAVRAAIRSGNPPPKQYIFPYCANPKEMSSPEMQRKYVEGPVGVLNLRAAGVPGMGASLGQWFVFTLVVSFFPDLMLLQDPTATPEAVMSLMILHCVAAVAVVWPLSTLARES